uniref:Uncharacterized protein n=1 Tax=Anguilla anguilla TaxID=7936 RepID=A0A0E9WGH5_ANGAN
MRRALSRLEAKPTRAGRSPETGLVATALQSAVQNALFKISLPLGLF